MFATGIGERVTIWMVFIMDTDNQLYVNKGTSF